MLDIKGDYSIYVLRIKSDWFVAQDLIVFIYIIVIDTENTDFFLLAFLSLKLSSDDMEAF